MEKKERNSLTLGEMIQKTDRQTNAVIEGEFYMKVYIPDDVDEAKIGSPSIVITKDEYINFRVPSNEEVEKMPEWKQKIIQLVCWKMLKKD